MGVPLASVYKGGEEGRPAGPRGAPMWSPARTPSPSRSPPRGREGEGRRGRRGGKGGRPPSPIRFGLGGRAPCLVLPPLFHHLAHEAQYFFPHIPVTPRYPRKYPNHSEPFRCPNIVVQYIDLYVSAISRLLVMSPISPGTPNYLRYIKSHKLIIQSSPKL